MGSSGDNSGDNCLGRWHGSCYARARSGSGPAEGSVPLVRQARMAGLADASAVPRGILATLGDGDVMMDFLGRSHPAFRADGISPQDQQAEFLPEVRVRARRALGATCSRILGSHGGMGRTEDRGRRAAAPGPSADLGEVRGRWHGWKHTAGSTRSQPSRPTAARSRRIQITRSV